MNTCDYCTHVEMCGWRKDVEGQGCEFYDDGNRWIPVKFRPLTEEEQKEYPDYCYMADYKMPDDNEEIFVTVKSGKGNLYVEKDVCYFDDGFSLDSGYDWQTDVVAWMPLPEPYKAD